MPSGGSERRGAPLLAVEHGTSRARMSETGRRTGSRPRGLRNFSLLERAITICDEPAVVRQRNRAKVINNCGARIPPGEVCPAGSAYAPLGTLLQGEAASFGAADIWFSTERLGHCPRAIAVRSRAPGTVGTQPEPSIGAPSAIAAHRCNEGTSMPLRWRFRSPRSRCLTASGPAPRSGADKSRARRGGTIDLSNDSLTRGCPD